MLKVLLAFVIIFATVITTVNAVQPTSFSGTALNFSVGNGAVSVTNASDQSVAVQMVGAGSRSFRVLSTDEAVAGASTTQGSGGSRTQLFEFDLPSGTSEFTITRGTDVNFIANSADGLQATINTMDDSSLQITLILAIVVILAALYYASNATEHIWLRMLRGQMTTPQNAGTQDTKPTPITVDGGQGQQIRSYGDNRGK